MTDEELVLTAGDKVETPTFVNNMMMELEISSASVGKKVTYKYLTTGGVSAVEVTDI